MVAWLGGPILGIANATVRERAYKDQVGELAAHQISTATGTALFAGYFWALERRWPLPTLLLWAPRRASRLEGAASRPPEPGDPRLIRG